MKEYSFEKLDVWKLGKDFCIKIYKLTENFPTSEKYNSASQLRRAALSIPTNLSEGSARFSAKDKARFTEIAFSSLMECMNLLIISAELNFIDSAALDDLKTDIDLLSHKLNNYRKSQLNP